MTEEQMEERIKALTNYRWVSTRLREIAIEVGKIRKVTYKHPVEECFKTIDDNGDGTFTAFFDEYRCGCCGPDGSAVSFPEDHLWDEDFIAYETEKYAAEIAEHQRLVDQKAAADEAARLAAKELKDAEDYERLKAKFSDR